MAIHITGDAAADQVLTDDPFALLVGMMLDQNDPRAPALHDWPVASARTRTLHAEAGLRAEVS